MLGDRMGKKFYTCFCRRPVSGPYTSKKLHAWGRYNLRAGLDAISLIVEIKEGPKREKNVSQTSITYLRPFEKPPFETFRNAWLVIFWVVWNPVSLWQVLRFRAHSPFSARNPSLCCNRQTFYFINQ